MIGLTIIPNNKPRPIHSLFIGKSISGFVFDIIKKAAAIINDRNAQTNKLLLAQYRHTIKKIAVKKKPNFRLDGNSKLDEFIILNHASKTN